MFRSSTTRVTLITQSFPPETHAGANRAIALANALSELSDLTVVAPMPSHPTPDRFKEAAVLNQDQQVPFEVRRTSAFKPHSSGYLRRGAREVALALSLASKVDRSTDIVVATTPSFFLAPGAKLASQFVRARFVWDIRDLTWEYALEALEDLPERQRLRRAGSRLMRSMAQNAARYADGVIASNAGIAEYFEAEFGCTSVHVSRNGVSRDVYRSLGTLHERGGNHSGFRVTYVGALGYFQALDTLLDAAEKLSDVEFRIVGDGPEKSRLRESAIKRELDNVSFAGFVGREQVYAEYADADVLFAQLRDTEVMGSSTVPSKVYEYLATGKPIIYGGSGITADFLRGTQAANVVRPQNMVELVDAVNELRDDPGLRQRMGVAGRASAKTRIREDIMGDAARRMLNDDGAFAKSATKAQSPPTDPLLRSSE